MTNDEQTEKVPTVYVLTHEYFDRSGFAINGVTANYEVALAWFKSNDEANVYKCQIGDISHWASGTIGWRST